MIALIALAAAAAAPQPGALRSYGDWVVGCDNGRACQANALVPDDDRRDAYLMLVLNRAAEPGAAPTLTWEATDALKNVPVALAVDGRRITAPGERASIAGAGAKAFANGRVITAVDAAGRVRASASLKGLSAAMLYIDESQRRLGTTTALVRTGRAVARSAPPALPIVAVPATGARSPRTVTAARATTLIGPDSAQCKGARVEPEAYRLDARTSLVLIQHPCGNGAYNLFASAYSVGEIGRVTAARFDALDGISEAGNDDLVNADFDAKTRRLTTFAKGRGVGDCGTISDYAWDGTRFRLVERRVMSQCRGSIDYITTWRASAP